MLFYAYFSVSRKRNIRWSQNGTKSTGEVIFGTNAIQETWSGLKKQPRRPREGRARRPIGRAPYLMGPSGGHRRTSSSYISLHTPKTSREPRRNISATVTFCIREIPSSSRRRRSSGGGIHHRGLLHQHHSPSDEL